MHQSHKCRFASSSLPSYCGRLCALVIFLVVAGTISFSSLGYANSIPYTQSQTRCVFIEDFDFQEDLDISGPINGSTSCDSEISSVHGFAEAHASTEYGLNWANGEVFSHDDTRAMFEANISSLWWDQWLIENPNQPTGLESSMTVYITLTGSLTVSTNMTYTFYQDLAGVIGDKLIVNQNDFENGKTYPIQIIFSYGESFDVGALLSAEVRSRDGYAHMSDITAELDKVFLPAGATLTATSGTNYAVIPLPSAIWLFGTGLISLGAIGWRRRMRK